VASVTSATIDQMCRRAQRAVRDLVKRRAEGALDEIRLAFERLRREHRLPPVAIYDSTYYLLPRRFQCPECGDRLFFEVDEWGTKDGIPTAGGIRIMCKAEEMELARAMAKDRNVHWQHRNWQSDWQPIQDDVERWAASRVRVYR
jgi:hypothetical protein